MFTTAIAICLFTTTSLPQRQSRSGPYRSLKEAASKRRSEVESDLDTRSLDRSDPFDAKIQKGLDNLNFGWKNAGFRGDVQILWIRKGSTIAHPDLGILVNRDELKTVLDRATRTVRDRQGEDFLYMAAIAHEYGHLAQYQRYGVDKALAYPNIVAELQADVLAGTWVGNQLISPLLENRPSTQSEMDRFTSDLKAKLDVVGNLVKTLGEMGDAEHGTASQREKALERGVTLALLPLYKALGAPTDKLERDLEFRYGREKAIDWSLKIAEKIAGVSSVRGTLSESGRAIEAFFAAGKSFERAQGKETDKGIFESRLKFPGSRDITVYAEAGKPDESWVNIELAYIRNSSQDALTRELDRYIGLVDGAGLSGFTKSTKDSRDSTGTWYGPRTFWKASDGRTIELKGTFSKKYSASSIALHLSWTGG